jgi:DNA-binding response OmpR family regulator
VLFVSGKATARDREYALKIGASEFLAKPFTPEELHGALNHLTKTPGFRVLPKAMTLAQIHSAEEERQAAQAQEEKFRKDRIQRKEESELEKFLREHT